MQVKDFSQDEDRRISKKMSYALRHNPEKYGLQLAADGSVPVQEFLGALNRVHHFDPPLTEDRIRNIMAHADKQRFFIESGRIRALYGHSFLKQIRHEEKQPPAVLYHGTSHRAYASIMKEGILPMKRQYVHLSADPETAVQVGSRRDAHPVILKVEAARAAADGIRFYVGNDKVWLSDCIPPEYLRINE